MNLISENNPARHGDGSSVMGGHLHLGNSMLDGYINRRLSAAVCCSEGNDRAVRYRIATTVAHRIRVQLKLLSRLRSAHFQSARITWNLPYDARGGNAINSRHELIGALLRSGIHLCPGRAVMAHHCACLHSAGWI